MIAWTLQWWDQNLTVWLKLFCTCIIFDFEITGFFLSLFTLFNFVSGIYDLMIWLSSVVALFRFDFRVPLAGSPPAPNRYMCTSFYWTIIPYLSQSHATNMKTYQTCLKYCIICQQSNRSKSLSFFQVICSSLLSKRAPRFSYFRHKEERLIFVLIFLFHSCKFVLMELFHDS